MKRIAKDRCGFDGYTCTGIPLLSTRLFQNAVLNCAPGVFGMYSIPSGVYSSSQKGYTYITDDIASHISTTIVNGEQAPICTVVSQVFTDNGLFDLAGYIESYDGSFKDLQEDALSISRYLDGTIHVPYKNGFIQPQEQLVAPPPMTITVEAPQPQPIQQSQFNSAIPGAYMAAFAAVASGNTGFMNPPTAQQGCHQFAISALADIYGGTVTTTSGNICVPYTSLIKQLQGTDTQVTMSQRTLTTAPGVSVGFSFPSKQNTQDHTALIRVICVVAYTRQPTIKQLQTWSLQIPYKQMSAYIAYIYPETQIKSLQNTSTDQHITVSFSSQSAAVDYFAKQHVQDNNQNLQDQKDQKVQCKVFDIGTVAISYTSAAKAYEQMTTGRTTKQAWLQWDIEVPVEYTVSYNIPAGFPEGGSAVRVSQSMCGPLKFGQFSQRTVPNAATVLKAETAQGAIDIMVSNAPPTDPPPEEGKEADAPHDVAANYAPAGISAYGIRALTIPPTSPGIVVYYDDKYSWLAIPDKTNKYALMWDNQHKFTWVSVSTCQTQPTPQDA